MSKNQTMTSDTAGSTLKKRYWWRKKFRLILKNTWFWIVPAWKNQSLSKCLENVFCMSVNFSKNISSYFSCRLHTNHVFFHWISIFLFISLYSHQNIFIFRHGWCKFWGDASGDGSLSKKDFFNKNEKCKKLITEVDF